MLQSMGLQRVRLDLATEQQQQIYIHTQKEKKKEGYTVPDISTINILISFMLLFAIKIFI